MKELSIQLTKCVQDLYVENFNADKGIKEDLIHERHTMFMNLKVQESKMLILSSMIYWVKKILNKMHASYFYRHRQAYYKLILKFTGKGTFPRIAEIILIKKN